MTIDSEVRRRWKDKVWRGLGQQKRRPGSRAGGPLSSGRLILSGNVSAVWARSSNPPTSLPATKFSHFFFGMKSSVEMWVTKPKSIFKNQWANRACLQVTQDLQAAGVHLLDREPAGVQPGFGGGGRSTDATWCR